MNAFQELFLYRSYRTFTGDIAPVEVYRHNGRLAARCVDPGEFEVTGASPNTWALVSQHLTPLERRTWWKLLGGRSIAAIAAEEGVERAAIYARIRGTNGKGGMVRKNPWVALWWKRRQHAHL